MVEKNLSCQVKNTFSRNNCEISFIHLLLLRYLQVLLRVLYAEYAASLIPTGCGYLIFYKKIKVKPCDKLRMMLKLVDFLLSVAVPNHDTHIIACTRKDIRMIWRKLNFSDSELVTHQHHQRLVHVGT